jgi:hypothetical protein
VACWSLRILDTVLAEDRDGNGKDERRRPCAESRWARVCALARLRGDQPGSVIPIRVLTDNILPEEQASIGAQLYPFERELV